MEFEIEQDVAVSGTYHINNEEGLVTIKSAPQVQLDSCCSVGKQILADPAFDPKLPQLIDLRGSHNHMSYDEELTFRDFVLQQYRPQVSSSIAIVVDDNMDSKVLARLYHLSSRMDKTELFDHYHQALKWLMRNEFASE